MTFNRELEKDEKKIALCMLCSAGGWVNTRPTSVDAEHENNIKQPRSMVMDTLPFSSVHILSSYPTSKADKRQNVLLWDLLKMRNFSVLQSLATAVCHVSWLLPLLCLQMESNLVL